MPTSETFTQANLWLTNPYVALRHGADIASKLYHVMTDASDSHTRTEAHRLYQRVQTRMSNIRSACPVVPKDCLRTAFLPVASYNDDTGESTTPTDYLTYPPSCTLAQRLQLQYAEAKRLLFRSQQPAKTRPAAESADSSQDEEQPETEDEESRHYRHSRSYR